MHLSAGIVLLAATHAFAGVLDARFALGDGLSSLEAKETGWPFAPFETEGRDIVNSKGDKVTWAGVNWPMSGASDDSPALIRLTK